MVCNSYSNLFPFHVPKGRFSLIQLWHDQYILQVIQPSFTNSHLEPKQLAHTSNTLEVYYSGSNTHSIPQLPKPSCQPFSKSQESKVSTPLPCSKRQGPISSQAPFCAMKPPPLPTLHRIKEPTPSTALLTTKEPTPPSALPQS